MPSKSEPKQQQSTGAHYAHFFTDMRRYLLHPELLEQPPEKVLFDHDLKFSEPKPKKAE